MGRFGINLAEEAHVVNILPPLDIDAAAQVSDVFSLRDYDHASILIQAGVTGATCVLTVFECDDFVPTNETAIPFSIYKEETDAGDTFGARTAVAAAGATLSANNNIMYLVEIDADELSEGFNKLRIKLTDPGAATFLGAMAILSGGIKKKITPTAIA